MGEPAMWNPDAAPGAEIESSFLDNERRRWTFAYVKDAANITLADFREVQVHGKTIDDPVHLLTAFSKSQTLFRITTFDPASDWLWACFRATRDLRKARAKTWKKATDILPRQPGVFRRKKEPKKGSRGRGRKKR